MKRRFNEEKQTNPRKHRTSEISPSFDVFPTNWSSNTHSHHQAILFLRFSWEKSREEAFFPLGFLQNPGICLGLGRFEGDVGFFSLFLKVAEAMQVEKIGAFGTRNPNCCLSPPPFSMKSDGFLGNASAERNSFLSMSSLFLSRSARKRRRWLLAPGAAIYDHMVGKVVLFFAGISKLPLLGNILNGIEWAPPMINSKTPANFDRANVHCWIWSC